GLTGLPLVRQVRRILTSRSLRRRRPATRPTESALRTAGASRRRPTSDTGRRAAYERNSGALTREHGPAVRQRQWLGHEPWQLGQPSPQSLPHPTGQQPRSTPSLSNRAGMHRPLPQTGPTGNTVSDPDQTGWHHATQWPEQYATR